MSAGKRVARQGGSQTAAVFIRRRCFNAVVGGMSAKVARRTWHRSRRRSRPQRPASKEWIERLGSLSAFPLGPSAAEGPRCGSAGRAARGGPPGGLSAFPLGVPGGGRARLPAASSRIREQRRRRVERERKAERAASVRGRECLAHVSSRPARVPSRRARAYPYAFAPPWVIVAGTQ